MVNSVVVLGPFAGGLNGSADASAIADNELSDCVNLNVDIDGSLVCRPPISRVPFSYKNSDFTSTGGILGIGGQNPWSQKTINFPGPPVQTVGGLGTGGPGTGDTGLESMRRGLVIGSWINNGIPQLIVSNDNGVFAFSVSLSSEGIEWLSSKTISTAVRSDCAIPVHNALYVLANAQSVGNSGTWDGSTWSAMPDTVRGSKAVFFKGRVWVAPGYFNPTFPANSQLRFSAPVALTTPITVTYPAENLIPVGQGDGENLIDMLVVDDNLMLFKNNSTYAFLFDVSPNDGVLRKVNSNIGASSQFCVLTHENEAYTYHEGKVYQISNYNFINTSLKVPFENASSAEYYREKVSLSLIGDFILLRYFNKMYALNLKTKTWSEWRSNQSSLNFIGRVVKLETNEVSSKVDVYYGGSIIPSDISMMCIRATHTTSNYEYTFSDFSESKDIDFHLPLQPIPIDCSMTTKVYDFGMPHVFKRLMWWGVDLISDGNITGIATSVRQSGEVTWESLETYSWQSLGPWDNAFLGATNIVTLVADTFTLRRKFMKMLKALRFRQISFTVKVSSSGQIASEETLGPARVFSLSAIVGTKQTTVKQVS